MESWSVIRLWNELGCRFSPSMLFVIHCDNIFEFNPPLRYQLHGLEMILNMINVFIFDPHYVLTNDPNVQKISLTELWALYRRWNLSVYVCVISKDIKKNSDTLKKQIQTFFKSVPTTTAGHVIFAQCKAESESKGHCHNLVEEIRSYACAIAADRNITVLCSHDNITNVVKKITKNDFLYALQLLDDKLASFEKQTKKLLEKEHSKAQDIEKEIIKFLQNLNLEDLNMALNTPKGKQTKLKLCLSDFLLGKQQNIIIDSVFGRIREHFDHVDRSVLRIAVQSTRVDYVEVLMQEKQIERILWRALISIANIILRYLYVNESERYRSLVINVFHFYCCVYQSHYVVTQTLDNLKQNSEFIAQRIAHIYGIGKERKVIFINILRSFRKDIKECRDDHEQGNI